MGENYVINISDGVLTIGEKRNRTLKPIGIYHIGNGCDFEIIGQKIKKLVKRNFFSKPSFSFCIDDSSCIYKNFSSSEKQRSIEKNIPIEFTDYIDSDFEDEYVYEYQSILGDDNDGKHIAVAANKNDLERYYELGNQLGGKINVIIPESIAELNIFSGKNEEYILVDIRENEVKFKIFKNGNIETRYESDEGIKSIIEIYKNYGKSVLDDPGPEIGMLYKDSSVKQEIVKVVANIVKTIDYYDEKRISDSSYDVCVVGKGALIRPLFITLQNSIKHKCVTGRDVVQERLTLKESALMFDLYGIV